MEGGKEKNYNNYGTIITRKDNSYIVDGIKSIEIEKKENYSNLNSSPSLSPSLSSSSSSSILHECTMIEAASNQIAVVTGAGMLSLPYAAASMGWSVLILLFILTISFCYSYLLLVYSIEKIRIRYQGSSIIVDYTILGKESFGYGGDKFVLIILISELFLALVSFFINIGLNLHVIFPSISLTVTIISSTIFTLFLSFANMKLLSRVTSIGNIMTVLTVLALALSGMCLPETSTLEYKFFDPRGIAASLGVMAYCYGGHGAFPKIYQSMGRREQVPYTISTVAIVVFTLYAIIISLGYYYYGSATKIPVTLNIGKDLSGVDLPSARLFSVLASLGLVFNIQATCPIIVVTITDMILTSMGHHLNEPSVNSQSYIPLNSDRIEAGKKMQRNIIIVLCIGALFVSLFLRDDFLEVCGLIGSVATIASSIFLPIAFYHCLYPLSTTPLYIIIGHSLLVILAILTMFVGVTSSLCGITHSTSILCSLTVPSN